MTSRQFNLGSECELNVALVSLILSIPREFIKKDIHSAAPWIKIDIVFSGARTAIGEADHCSRGEKESTQLLRTASGYTIGMRCSDCTEVQGRDSGRPIEGHEVTIASTFTKASIIWLKSSI